MRKSYHNSKSFSGGGGLKSATALKLAPEPVQGPAATPLSKSRGTPVVLFPPHLLGNPARAYVWRLAFSGRRSAESRLETFAAFFNHTLDTFHWFDLTAVQLDTALGLYRELGATAASVNMMRSHVRSVARRARLLDKERMSAERCAEILEVEGVKGSGLPAGRALPQQEVDALFKACREDASPAGVRDLALLSALYYGGLRRDEVCGLRLEDYQARQRRIHVLGKGEKEEIVPVESKRARLALSRWARLRGDAAGPFFCSLRRGGALRVDEDTETHETRVRALTGDAVYKIVRRRAELADIPPCTPHDLRRSAITNLLEGGADPLAVQEWARHESVETTRVYDRRRERAKRICARRLDPAPTRPRPRRKPHRPKRGRPRMSAPLETRPRAELVALARAHQCEFGEHATCGELARLIRAAVDGSNEQASMEPLPH